MLATSRTTVTSPLESTPMALLLLAGQLGVVSVALFVIFRLRDRLGLGPLFLLLGANQVMSVLLAATVYFPLTASIAVSPGSAILFPTALVAVLLVYLCEDIPKTRTLIFSVVLINIGGILLLWLTQLQLTILELEGILDVPASLFEIKTRVFVVGTVVLLMDFFLLVISYQFMERKLGWTPRWLRITGALVLTLLFDSLAFGVGAFYGTPSFDVVLTGQLSGKGVAGVLYGLLVSIYVHFFESGWHTADQRTESLDVLSILTYQERYEIVREKLLEERKASLAKSQFLAHMSHELRTPLNAIIGFTKLLLLPKPIDDEDKRTLYLERVHDNARHLLVLINDMLDLSKIEAGKLELQYHRVSLNELVTETVEQLRSQAAAKGLELSVEMSGTDLALETDPTRLRQVLINLLGNAIKFTPQGRVVVRLLTKDDRSLEPACLEVSDTGIGIRPELHQQVFEAFSQVDSSSTRSFDGSGLGLAISRALCREMGYELQLESAERQGSTFSVIFP